MMRFGLLLELYCDTFYVLDAAQGDNAHIRFGKINSPRLLLPIYDRSEKHSHTDSERRFLIVLTHRTCEPVDLRRSNANHPSEPRRCALSRGLDVPLNETFHPIP